MTLLRAGLIFDGHAQYNRKGFSSAGTPGAAPTQTAADALTPGYVPGNLRAISSADPAVDGSLKWDAVPAQTPLGTLLRYEILAYQRLVGTVPAGQTTHLPAPPENDADPPFSVRAVYGMTMAGVTAENPSLASNCCMQVFQWPTPLPSYVATSLPTPALHVTATPQWNSGAPLNLVEWYADATAQFFRVDRDGVTVAEGLFTLEYLDAAVLPGSSHVYTVYRMDGQQTPTLYSPPSAPAAATALSGPPALDPALTPQNITVYGYDGNAIVEFDAPYAFVDARIYNVATPDEAKYAGANPVQVSSSGQNLGPVQRRTRIAIQVDVPAGGADFHVEFVDKLGPATETNMAAMPSMAGMALPVTSTNGHGPPVNVPFAIGPPALLHLTGLPASDCISNMDVPNFVSGKFLPFHDPDVFTPIPIASLSPEFKASYDYNSPYAKDLAYFSAPDLTAVMFEMNTADSNFFFMKRHLMDFGVESGGPGSPNPPHNANGGNYFQMEPGTDGLGVFTVAPNEVLQFFGIVDNPQGLRRWVDFFLKSVGDPFLNPGKFRENNIRSTESGNLLRFQNKQDSIQAALFYPNSTPYAADKSSSAYAVNLLSDAPSEIAFADWSSDLGVEFELTIQYQAGGGVRCRTRNRTRWTNDLTLQGGGLNLGGYDQVIEAASNTFQWPWAASQQLQIATDHEVYHLAIDARQEGMNSYNHRRYQINRRPYNDERHWHGLGYRKLSQWPSN